MKITTKQRDALYDQVLDRPSGIGDIWLAASSEKYGTADRLGREYSDELRLVLDDLGWGDGPDEEMIELTAPTEVLQRLFTRLREAAISERSHGAADWAESRQLQERNRLIAETCEKILASLDSGGRQ
ncbi:MAG: hypothetical protein JSS68_09655 [Actinobacteria bacterium]|nr:hypothetical protein [Actinomycetota bacterium]